MKSNKPKIIATNFDLSSQAKKKLEKEVEGEYVLRDLEEITPNEYGDVEVILLNRRWKSFTDEGLTKMPNLKLIQTMSAGVDHLDFQMVPERVTVCGNVGAYSDAIAEHVFGMVLCLGKNLMGFNKELSQGIFNHRTISVFLKGKTMGILGTGGIGESVARLAKVFGMRTMGINSSGHTVRNFDTVYDTTGIEKVLSESDVVVLALPLTVKTRHIIDSKKLQMMKKECIFVNVARGELVDELALYEHMKSNPNFKVGLDVWWKYPVKGEKFAQDFPFFDLPNFLGTPHVSGDVPESYEISSLSAVENILRFIKGDPLKGVMNRNDYLNLKRTYN
jgi:phosphoglycerate dehydrogenase-like enzyme